MMKAIEVKNWLQDIPDDSDIAIDEGGLCLVEVGTKAYIEIGGEPLPEDGTE